MRFLILIGLASLLTAGETAPAQALPTLLDLGSVKCAACKQMSGILEELKARHPDRLAIRFIDVNAGPEGAKAATDWKINLIPTLIFLDAAGKELFRHEGVMLAADIEAKWKELKVELGPVPSAEAMLQRQAPLAKDERPKDQVCAFSGRSLDPAQVVTIAAPAGPIRLASPHLWAIYHSCSADAAQLPTITSLRTADGQELNIAKAFFAWNADTQGKTTVTAFATRIAAQKAGGMVLDFTQWLAREQAARCGFCDRSVYPDEAARVQVNGLHTYGCCAHCAMGVAARMKQDLVVEYPDNQTGEIITIRTQDLKIASVTPAGAVAWFGQKPGPEGKLVSAGCFHQGFFTCLDHLKAWLEARPWVIGEQISFQRSLDDKLKLSVEQIRKACKVGACK